MRFPITSVVFLIISLGFQNAFGQKSEWKYETTSDGVQVQSRFDQAKDSAGKDRQVVEYRAKRKAKVDFDKCVLLIQNPERHKDFMEEVEVSRKIKDVSSSEFIMYYLFNSPWPLPDADCIMQLKKEEKGNTVLFTGFSVPSKYPMQNVERMIYNYVEYRFTKLGDGMVEIEIYAKMTPPTQAPDWLVSVWFPEGPQKIINGLIINAKN